MDSWTKNLYEWVPCTQNFTLISKKNKLFHPQILNIILHFFENCVGELKNMVKKIFRNSNFSDFLGIRSEISHYVALVDLNLSLPKVIINFIKKSWVLNFCFGKIFAFPLHKIWDFLFETLDLLRSICYLKTVPLMFCGGLVKRRFKYKKWTIYSDCRNRYIK